MNEKTEGGVELVRLPECRVVSAYGFGEGPEMKAHSLLRDLVARLGWDGKELGKHRVFGFNNPDPAPGSSAYGYEYWMTVDGDFMLPEGSPAGVELKTMNGGLYASLLSPGVPNPAKWGGVVRWLNGSGYQYDGSRQWLEEHRMDSPAGPSFTGAESDPETWLFNLMSPVVPASFRVT